MDERDFDARLAAIRAGLEAAPAPMPAVLSERLRARRRRRVAVQGLGVVGAACAALLAGVLVLWPHDDHAPVTQLATANHGPMTLIAFRLRGDQVEDVSKVRSMPRGDAGMLTPLAWRDWPQ